MKITTIIAATLLGTAAVHAQKIDFDMSNRNTSEVTEEGFTSWQVPQAPADSKTVGALTIGVAASGDATVLRSQWSKTDVKSGKANLKLIGDGVVAYIADDGGNTPNQTSRSVAIEVTVSGLSTGRHTIQAYHNGVNGYTQLAPVDVYVDGRLTEDDLPQSENAQSIDEAAVSYVSVDVAEGADVRLVYRSDPKSGTAYGSSLVYVNALIFDQASTQLQAGTPVPEDRDYHVDADDGTCRLSWTPARNAVRHHIYIGSQPDNLAEAAVGSDAAYTATGLSSMTTYYWRIDEEDASGIVTEGSVWSFRPRHLAFPGAEGYGKYAIGGRGGTVYHVTTLDDNGDDVNPVEGSLRYGIKKVSVPRTIVFDVAGVIDLKNRLTCSDPYVTVAGQTAPGSGILLRTCPFGMASDGITRFLRLRLGHKRLVDGVIPGGHENPDGSYGADADRYDETTVHGVDGMGMAGNDNSIMDHCSISWTIDEGFSSRNAQSITLQRTIISEALNNAGHPNYPQGTRHGYAATIGGGEMSARLTVGSYHHNLLAHNEGRNWSLSGGLDGGGYYDGHHDIYNNVVYDWGGRATDGGTHECNFTANFYKMGRRSSETLLNAQIEGTGRGTQSYYVSGNIRQARDNGALQEDREGTTYRYSASQDVTWDVFVNSPFFPSLGEIGTAREAYKNVLSDVGCNQPFADNHDRRMVTETISGTTSTKGSRTGYAGLIDSEEDDGCEGFGGLGITTERRPDGWDTDADGMPDWWETAHATLNRDIADNNDDPDGDGYTNLEDYLNWMAAPHFMLADAPMTVNLKDYFAGYANNPSFAIEANEGSLAATINGTDLIVSATSTTAAFPTLTIRATDDDGWGSFARTLNFYTGGTADGITTVVTDEAPSDEAMEYNIAGQRVGRTYRGIVIKRGKKVIK